MTITKRQIEQAVEWACSVAVPEFIILEDTLLERAEMTRPGIGHTFKEHNEFRFDLMRLRTIVTSKVLKTTKYKLKAVQGLGFRVLPPDEVVADTEMSVRNAIINGTSKALTTLKHADVPSRDSRRKEELENSLRGIEAFAKKDLVDKERRRKFKEDRAARQRKKREDDGTEIR